MQTEYESVTFLIFESVVEKVLGVVATVMGKSRVRSSVMDFIALPTLGK